MKNFILILFHFFILLEINGQQVYFNNRYDIEHGLEAGSGIIKRVNGYITIGFSRTNDFSTRFFLFGKLITMVIQIGLNNLNLTVYDMQGRPVLKQVLVAGVNRVGIDFLSSGIYAYTVEGKGFNDSGKFVKE
ncbi:MAG: T9SS type A sorting domain-containing protein [Bacteroidetes bacterium]|nr:T9SS type A sorting domain-containing protein [Bacteroidota bacterium]